MRGNRIVISEDPRGRFLEGIVSGTPKPGTIMQIKAGTAVDANGHHTWEAYNRAADSNRPQGPLAVLRERGEGYAPFTITSGTRTNDGGTAYVDGDECFLYIPLPGDECNVLWSTSGTSTGDSLTVGQIGIVDDGTGYIVDTTGSPEIEPVIAMEALTDTVAAGTLAWVMFSGY